MLTYEQTLRKDDHTRRFQIQLDDRGWRVLERSDATVVRDATYTDWHRVERVRRAFNVETSTLRAEGWLDGH